MIIWWTSQGRGCWYRHGIPFLLVLDWNVFQLSTDRNGIFQARLMQVVHDTAVVFVPVFMAVQVDSCICYMNRYRDSSLEQTSTVCVTVMAAPRLSLPWRNTRQDIHCQKKWVLQGRYVMEFLRARKTRRRTNAMAFSPQANYTDWATAADGRILVPTFADRWVTRGQRNGTPRLLIWGFLGRSRCFFFEVAPQLSSPGWVDAVPDPKLLRKSGSAGNRTGDLWVCSHEPWPLDHRGIDRLGLLFEIVKNAVFWDVTPCSCCKNWRFGGMYRLHHQGDKNWRATNVSNN
jgi:hypothetical protein